MSLSLLMSYQAVIPISGILCVRVCIHSRNSGKCEQWMKQADPHVKKVSETVCGPLLQELCEQSIYWDMCCVEVFRLGTSLWYTLLHLSFATSIVFPGAALFGKLPGGVVSDETVLLDVEEFAASKSQCWHSNLELLESLREDDNSHAVHELAKADHDLGRMTLPVPVESIDLASVRCVHAPCGTMQF